MLVDPQEIVKNLTPDHKTCILALTEEWQSTGYSRVHADILYAIGDTKLYGKLPSLVECEYHRPIGQSPVYRHKLTDKGLEVKQHLASELV